MAPVRTGHAEMDHEWRLGVCSPRMMNLMSSEVRPEAQLVDLSWQDRANMSWRSRQARSGTLRVGYLRTIALAGRKVILGLK